MRLILLCIAFLIVAVSAVLYYIPENFVSNVQNYDYQNLLPAAELSIGTGLWWKGLIVLGILCLFRESSRNLGFLILILVAGGSLLFQSPAGQWVAGSMEPRSELTSQSTVVKAKMPCEKPAFLKNRQTLADASETGRDTIIRFCAHYSGYLRVDRSRKDKVEAAFAPETLRRYGDKLANRSVTDFITIYHPGTIGGETANTIAFMTHREAFESIGATYDKMAFILRYRD